MSLLDPRLLRIPTFRMAASHAVLAGSMALTHHLHADLSDFPVASLFVSCVAPVAPLLTTRLAAAE